MTCPTCQTLDVPVHRRVSADIIVYSCENGHGWYEDNPDWGKAEPLSPSPHTTCQQRIAVLEAALEKWAEPALDQAAWHMYSCKGSVNPDRKTIPYWLQNHLHHVREAIGKPTTEEWQKPATAAQGGGDG
jgi:hypothetical protein